MPMNKRNSPMPTAKLCLRLGAIADASQVRAPQSVSKRNNTPATNTEPRHCCQLATATTVKAINAFSPIYGATAIGRLA
jgi:hypothetical protein